MVQRNTKERIRESFVALLNQRPLSQITVKEIASASQINRNTFYYHYSDVYQLLSEIFERELAKAFQGYNDTLSWEEGFLVGTQFALDNQKAIYNVYNSMQKEEVVQYIFEIAGTVMERYVERESQGIAATAEDKVLIATFYQCALTEMVIRWVATGMKEEPQKIILRIGALFDGNITRSLQRSAELSAPK